MNLNYCGGWLRRVTPICGMAVIVAGLLPLGAPAANTSDWNKTTANLYWQTPGNWTPGTVPNGIGDMARITNNIGAARTINITNAVTLGELWIGSAAAFAITLSDTNSSLFTFDNGGAGAWIRKFTGAADLINVPITLNDTLTITNTTASSLTLASNITEAVVGESVTVYGNVTLKGVNTFTGGLLIKSGTLIANSSVQALGGNGLGTVTLGDTSGSADALLQLSTGTWTNPLTVASGSSGSAALTNNGAVAVVYAGSITLNKTLTVDPGNATGSMNLSNNITGTGGLIKNGTSTGAMTLGASNSFSGGVTLNAGLLTIANTNALGTGTLTINGGTIAGNGSTATNAVAINNDFTLSGNSGATVANFSGPVALGGAGTARTITESAASSGTGSPALNGAISDGVTANSITKMGGGGLTLAGASTFSGGVILGAGVLFINSSSTATTGPLGIGALTISNATVFSTPGTNARTISNAVQVVGDFTLGVDVAKAPLTLAGSMDLNGANRTITPVSTNCIISGQISDGALTIGGGPYIILSGNNTFTGDLTIKNTAHLTVTSDASMGLGTNVIIQQNGALLASNTFATSKNIVMATGAGGSVGAGAGNTLTIDGVFSNYASAPTFNSGTIRLDNAGNVWNANGGVTNVLLVNGSAIVQLGDAAALNGISLKYNGGLGLDNVTGGALTPIGMRGLLLTSGFTFNGNGGTNDLDLSGVEAAFIQTTNSIRTITVSNSTLTISGLLSTGSLSNSAVVKLDGGLTKAGNGTLIINSASDYSFGTTISAGTLQLGSYNALLRTGSNMINGATAVYDLGGFSTVTNGAVTLGAGVITNGTLVGSSYTLSNGTVYAALAGAATLTKVGSSNVTLSGANTYSGGTVINGGVLQFNSANAIGGSGANVTNNYGATAAAGYAMDQSFLGRLDPISSGTVAMTVSSGNNLDFNAANLAGVSLGAIGIVTNNGTITAAGGAYQLGGGGGTLVLTSANALTGANSLMAFNSGSGGTLVLASANNFTGGWTNNAGVLVVQNSAALGTSTGLTNMVVKGAVLQLDGTAGNLTLGTAVETLNLNGSSSSAALENIAGSNTYAGAIIIGSITGEIAAASARINSDAGTLVLSGGITRDVVGGTANQNLWLGGSGNILINGAIQSLGSGAMTKDGTGALTLTTANSGWYHNMVLSNGTLNINNASAVGGAHNQFNIFNTPGGTSTVDNTSGAPITLVNEIVSINGNFTFNGTTNLDFGAVGGDLGTAAGTLRTITVNANTLTLSGPLTNGTTATGIILAGAGKLLLTASNVYTGSTTIGSGSTFMVGGAGVLNGGIYAGLITNNGTYIYASSQVQSNTGVISGSGNLVVSNSGGFYLSGANSYAGGTTLTNSVVYPKMATAFGTGGVIVLSNATIKTGGLTISNAFTLSGSGATGVGTPITYGALVGVNNSTYAGPITLNGGAVIAAYTANLFTNTFTQGIGGTGDLTLAIDSANNGSGTFYLNGQSTYSGNTYLTGVNMKNQYEIFQLGTNNALPTTTILNMQTPNASNNWAQVVLNGFNQQVAGLVSATAQNISTNIITGSSATLSTLTINTTTNTTFDGNIGGSSTIYDNNLALVKMGSGILTLSSVNGGNSYTGGTFIGQGMLSLSNNVALPGMANNGAFVVSNGATLAVGGAVGDAGINTLLNTTNFLAGANLGYDTSAGSWSSAAVVTDSVNGALGVVLIGNNALTLMASNSYSGGTLLSAGKLVVSNNNALGTGVLTLNGGVLSNGVASFAVANTINLANASNTVGVLGGSTLTLSGTITNSGSLTKAGTGTLVLGGANSYSGGTVLSAGTLLLGNVNALGTGPLTNTGAGFTTALGASTDLSAGLGVTNAITTALNLNMTNLNNLTLSGPVSITGTGYFYNYGPANLNLNGAFSVANNFYVNQGSVTFNGNTNDAIGNLLSVGNLAGSTGSLIISNGTVTAVTLMAGQVSGGTGIVNQVGGTVTLSTALGLANAANTPGVYGAYYLSGGTLNPGPNLYIAEQNNSTGLFAMAGGQLNATAMQVGRAGAAATNSAGYYWQSGGTATVSSLWLAGSGVTTNTYGEFAISNGVFSATTFSSLAASPGSTGVLYFGQGSMVTLPAFPTTRGTGSGATLTFDGGTLSNSATSTSYLTNMAHVWLTTKGATFAVGQNITVSQALEDFPGQQGVLTKTGAGTLTLAGTSTYSGATTNRNGTLQLGVDNALPTTTTLYVDTLGTFNLNGHKQTLAGIDGSKGMITNAGSLTLNFATTQSFLGQMAGPATLTLTGGGTLNITGTNNFSYTTVTNGSRLAVNGMNGGVITVYTNSSVGGTGPISTLVVNSGVYGPGNSPGTQTVASLTITNSGILSMDLGTNGYDRVVVTSSLVLADPAYLQLNLANYDPAVAPSKLVLVDWTSGGIWNGSTGYDTNQLFRLLDPGYAWSGMVLSNGMTFSVVGGNTTTNMFTINYDDIANGNQITLTAVPEPGTASLLGMVGVAWLFRRLRQRKTS